MQTTQQILQNAKKAKMQLSIMTKEVKNKVLVKISENILKNKEDILKANKIDVEKAQDTLSEVMIDRLLLNEDRIKKMADSVLDVALLEDPVGKILERDTLRNGLEVKKVSVPIGVIGIIYESRPNVTLDAGVLCFKSGNVCVLRGGKEAFNTSYVIVQIMRKTLKELGINENCISLIEDTSRQSSYDLMTAVGFIDALIPRGGASLIKACVENAKVPCIQTGTGICHIYVDEFADLNKALSIIENAKTSRPSVCNACEVCLVNANIAKTFLPMLKQKLVTERKNKNLQIVEFRCDEQSLNILGGTLAKEEDFDTEFLDYILAVKIVENVEEAIEHISQHSTQHSDCIISENNLNCENFTKCVDSSAVYVNASTRFTDGGEFGKGCEIGISTQKLHARGPMGLKELCSYKYILNGNGQIR
ncbi:MAG: glutamate-5-semialdehyde dehydrogenase [Clostridia bacterium]|nr:glutamate-5-semialdehyde dehydrogenase [Clostridia bacterium]